MISVLAIAAGGALGAVARYLTAGWIQGLSGGFLPLGTVAVNVLGSFLLGFLMIWFQASVASAELRQLVTIGFLGSFTTFSTFSYETFAMLRDGEWWRAGGYATASLLLGLGGVAVGVLLASNLLRVRS